jgi:hypothetical protein
MATRGVKPKPAHLRLVDGSHRTTRHGKAADVAAAVESYVEAFGRPTKPAYFKGQAARAWKQFIEPATWLDASREPSAIAFCELWQEFRDGPRMFPASRHAQMRAYMSDLGLTYAARQSRRR